MSSLSPTDAVGAEFWGYSKVSGKLVQTPASLGIILTLVVVASARHRRRTAGEQAGRGGNRGAGAAVNARIRAGGLSVHRACRAHALASALGHDCSPSIRPRSKSKVSGEIRQVTVREGQAVKAGQVLVRFDTADLEAKLTGPRRRARSQPRPARAGRKRRGRRISCCSSRTSSRRPRTTARRATLSVTQGTLKSIESAGSAGEETPARRGRGGALSGTVAKRHVQPGEKVNFDAPLVTIVDLTEMELQAMVPANDTPALRWHGKWRESTIDGFGDRRFTGTIERINPTTEAGTRAILSVHSTSRTPTRRCAAACSGPARVTWPPGSRCPRCPSGHPDRGRAGVRLDHREWQARAPNRHRRPAR